MLYNTYGCLATAVLMIPGYTHVGEIFLSQLVVAASWCLQLLSQFVAHLTIQQFHHHNPTVTPTNLAISIQKTQCKKHVEITIILVIFPLFAARSPLPTLPLSLVRASSACARVLNCTKPLFIPADWVRSGNQMTRLTPKHDMLIGFNWMFSEIFWYPQIIHFRAFESENHGDLGITHFENPPNDDQH